MIPSLIVFGALEPLPAPNRLDQLQYALQHQTSLKPLTEAAQELPFLWRTLLHSNPNLHSIAGERAADQLALWWVFMSRLVFRYKAGTGRKTYSLCFFLVRSRFSFVIFEIFIVEQLLSFLTLIG